MTTTTLRGLASILAAASAEIERQAGERLARAAEVVEWTRW
jgi:hypothetical protein